jgi:hypothetical protein
MAIRVLQFVRVCLYWVEEDQSAVFLSAGVCGSNRARSISANPGNRRHPRRQMQPEMLDNNRLSPYHAAVRDTVDCRVDGKDEAINLPKRLMGARP